jgi:hypothetical protein
VFGGAALVVAGIAAFIEASSHRPVTCEPGIRYIPPCHASRLSQTPYDLLRIGAWALVIFGGLLVITGVIRYWAAQTRAHGDAT